MLYQLAVWKITHSKFNSYQRKQTCISIPQQLECLDMYI